MRTRMRWMLFAVLVSVLALDARADLALRATPNPISIAQGGNADVTLQPEKLEGFPENAQTIEFTLKDFGAGTGVGTPTAYLPGLQPVSLKIVVNSDTAPGTYPATISAVVKDASGTVIGDKDFPEAFLVNVTAASCDFQLSATPPTFRIVAGGTAMIRVEASLSGGCSGPFTFSATTPPGMTADGPHTVEAPNTTVTFNYTLEPSMQAGSHSIEIRVEGGGTSRSVAVPFDVKVLTPKLTVEVPPEIELRAGETIEVPIVIRAEFYNGPIQYQTKAPAGVTVEPAERIVQVGEPVMVMVRTDAGAQPLPPGADLLYLTVQATAGGQLIHKQLQTKVRIVPAATAAAPAFEVAIEPRELEVKPNETGTYTVSARQTGGAPGSLRAISVSNPGGDTMPNDPTLGIAMIDPVSFALTPDGTQQVSVRVASYVPAGRYRIRWLFQGVRDDGSQLENPVEHEMVVVVPGAPAPAGLQISVDPQEASLDPTGIPTVYTVNVTAPPGEEVDTENLDVPGVSLGTLERAQSGTTTTFKIPISGLITGPQTLTFRFVTRPNFLRGSVSVVAHPGARTLVPHVEPSDVSLWPGESATLDIGIREIKGVYKVLITAVPESPDVKATLAGGEMLPPFDSRAQLRIEVEPGVQSGTRKVNLHFSDPNAGPTPAAIRTVPVEVKVKKIDANVEVDSASADLRPGESRTVRVTVTGKDGWSGPVSVDVKADAGVSVQPAILQIESLPGSAELTLRADDHAGEASVPIRLQARPHGRDWTMDSKTFHANILGPPAAFAASAIPSRLAIESGSFEKFTVVVEREGGWNGAVDVKIGGNDRVTVEPKSFRLEPGSRTAEITVRVPEGTPGTDGPEASLIIAVTPVGKGDPKREAFVALNLKAPMREAAFSIGSTHDDVWITASDPARFKLFAAGQNQWNGKVRVTARYEHAQPELAGRPDSEIVIAPQTFTLDTADPASQSQEIVVSTGPQFSFRRDDMSNSGKYGAYTTKGYRIIFDATPETGGAVKSHTVKLGTRPFPKGESVVALTPPGPIQIARAGRVPFSVEVRSKTSYPLLVSVTASHPQLIVTPPQTQAHTSDQPFAMFTLEGYTGSGSGYLEPVIVKAVPLGGAESEAETLTIPVQVARGAQKPGKDNPLIDPVEPVFPEPELSAATALEAVPQSVKSEVRDMRTAWAQLPGLASALEQSGLGSSEAGQEQVGFLRLHEAILDRLENAPLAANDVDDDALFASLFDGRPTVRASYTTAALMPTMLFQLRPVDGVMETPADLKKRMDWPGSTPAELLIQGLRRRNMAQVAQPGLSRMNELAAELDQKIEELPESADKIKRVKRLFKLWTIAKALVIIADQAGQASLAYDPYDITKFYLTVNGQQRDHRQLNDAIPITTDEDTEVQVFVEARSKGGPVGPTPQQIVETVAQELWGRIPDEKKQRWGLGDERSLKSEAVNVVKGWLSQVWSEVSKAPEVKKWIDWYGSQYSAPAKKFPPVDVNNARILQLVSNSTALLETPLRAAEGGRAQRYVLRGIHQTAQDKTAGYLLSFHDAYRTELQEAAARANVDLWRVPGWVTIKLKPATINCPQAGQRCVLFRNRDGSVNTWGVYNVDTYQTMEKGECVYICVGTGGVPAP